MFWPGREVIWNTLRKGELIPKSIIFCVKYVGNISCEINYLTCFVGDMLDLYRVLINISNAFVIFCEKSRKTYNYRGLITSGLKPIRRD